MGSAFTRTTSCISSPSCFSELRPLHPLPRTQRSTWKASSLLLQTPVIRGVPGQAHLAGSFLLPLSLAGLPASVDLLLYLCALRTGHLTSVPGLYTSLPCGDAQCRGPHPREYCPLDVSAMETGLVCHARSSPEHQAYWWGSKHIVVAPNWSPHFCPHPLAGTFRIILLKHRHHHVTLCSKPPVASDHTQNRSQPSCAALQGPCNSLNWSPTFPCSPSSRQASPGFRTFALLAPLPEVSFPRCQRTPPPLTLGGVSFSACSLLFAAPDSTSSLLCFLGPGPGWGSWASLLVLV